MENYAFQPKELNAGNSALGLELCCREEHFVLLKFLLLRPDRPAETPLITSGIYSEMGT